MSIFRTPSDRQVNIGITILRLVVGTIFVVHGAQKIFVFGFDGVAGAFGQMGIPMAGILGPFVALVEFFGGLALITGLLTRIASLGLLANMIVAILKVHLPNGFFAPTGIEFPLSLAASTLALSIMGAGRWSIDAMIAGRTKTEIEAAEPQRVRRAA